MSDPLLPEGKKVPRWRSAMMVRWWAFKGLLYRIQSWFWRKFHRCERCGARPAKVESSRTAYHWDGNGEDPNRDPWLCAACAREHHTYWDEMWDEYYRGRL